jgi:hypothetical protein
MDRRHIERWFVGAVLLASAASAANDTGSDGTNWPPHTLCAAAASGPPGLATPSNTGEIQRGAELWVRAARTVDTVMSGTLLVPEDTAHSVQYVDAIDALSGPVGKRIVWPSKRAAATAQVYREHATEGVGGAAWESTQVITDLGAELLVVQGSALAGEAFFGPPGADAGEMVGKGSMYVGSLIRKVPCSQTNVEACVLDLKHGMYDHWRSSPQCDDNASCYEAATSRTNVEPPQYVDPALSQSVAGSKTPTNDSGPNRQRMESESEFHQIAGENQAPAALSPAQAEADTTSAPSPQAPSVGFDWSAFGTLISNRSAAPAGAASASASSRNTPTILAGWVPCDCSAKHSASGRWLNGVLYRPEGPRC